MTGYFFNGRLVVTPAAMTQVNDTAMVPTAPGVGNNLALVGHAAAGQPQTPLVFGSPQDAINQLVSGDLLDAVVRAFNPSNDTGGPSSVTAIRVDPAVQAQLPLRDSSASVVINLFSADYGLRQNQVKVKVEPATGLVGVKITTQLGSGVYAQDNIHRNAYSIQYSGAQASAVMQVSTTTVTLQAPSGTPVATIDLATYPTIQQLVDRINATPGFSAAVLDGNGQYPTLNGLDTVAAQDVKTASYNATAHLQAIVDWFNTSPYVTAVRAASVGTLPAPIPFTYLTGGTDGTAMNTDWSNAINVLQGVDVQWVVALSNDPSIHAMVDAHVQFMSNQGAMERRACVGTPLATADTAALALAKAINSNRTSMIHLGGWDYDQTGQLSGLILYQPYIVAAMFAAAFCGMNPGNPMTGKSLRLQGLERTLRVPTDTDPLLLGGIVPLVSNKNGFQVAQSISTWLSDTKFDKREQSVGTALDYACRFIRESVETAVKGKKGTPQTLSLALETAKTCCAQLALPEQQGGVGVLAGDANNPPYLGLTANLSGDVIAISGQLSPVLPVNYIPITINAVPYSGTSSIS